ncbi:amidohydrolase family protein [Albimonas pacifica]|uniref:5-methylthioadenosine/S-adenosylhomocysteine deaminase n=1 Tax=Albimonas pacifica TaxID=1114924 RepID=A0A1I3CJV6_9RHOB|nr:amidohydrolase family protein [Albimonas pacifica]SFH74777.1 5-methylthioadenosine/S-adenosylhomocysteine deaminase [Albimonas pacifica]
MTDAPRPPEPVDLLVSAGFMYPGAADPGAEAEVVTGAEVAVRDGRILYAGPACDPGRWAPAERLGGPGLALLPGFVNAHCHAASTVFRGQFDDGIGQKGLYTVSFRGESRVTPEDWRILARLGVAEMILAGYTTLNDFWYCPDAMAELALETGLRLQVSTEIFDVDKPSLADGDYTRHAAVGEARLREGVRVAETWHGAGDGLITARIGPHAADTCSGGLHLDCAAEARRLGVGLHCHVAQSPQEVAQVQAENNGMGPAEWLAEIGALGPDWVLAHLTRAGPRDLAAVAQTGAGYAHCSTIYPRRGHYPDLAAIRAAGIRTGFGSDWMMNDPFEGMRYAMNALRLREGRSEALRSDEALHHATAGAAEVLGLGGRVGRLVPGLEADLILVDLETPHMQPYYGVPSSLIFYARASDVRHAVIRGRVAMRDRKVAGIDVDAALRAVQARAPALAALIAELGGAHRLGACPCGMH